MKVIIAGGRDYRDYETAKKWIGFYLKNTDEPIEIISGRCNAGTETFTTDEGVVVCGADGLGERYAKENNIPVIPVPADWRLGTKGGGIRNSKMADIATHLIAFHDGKTTGTANMIKKAKAKKLHVRVVKYQP